MRRGVKSLVNTTSVFAKQECFKQSALFATQKRNIVTAEEETAVLNKKVQLQKELIAKVLIDPKNETVVTPNLRLLSSLITSKQDYVDAMTTATKLSAQLSYAGFHDVGFMNKKKPVRVAVTGAAGAIGYALIPRILSGEMLGPDQPVILQLIERNDPTAMNSLQGVVMEMEDCAFPLCRGIVATSDIAVGFKDADYVFLVGAKPRTEGMERGDLLKDNAKIFQEQGKALNDYANKTALVLVVGNPANTNALVASQNAPKLNPSQFSAMMRLDHDRALGQIAKKVGCRVSDISQLAVWGNHSSTQYPDVSYAKVFGKAAKTLIKDDAWINATFVPTVQKRGSAIIAARGASSALSAADAALKHMRDWALGSNGEWVSMAVPSDGSYGIKEGVYCSYPVVCTGNGKYEIVKNLQIDAASRQKIDASVKELVEEKTAVAKLAK